jgi:peptidoglycan hydrolase CwlO-like protein
MKMEINTQYTANPKYTELMNRERALTAQIARLQAELREVTSKKQSTEPYVVECA